MDFNYVPMKTTINVHHYPMILIIINNNVKQITELKVSSSYLQYFQLLIDVSDKMKGIIWWTMLIKYQKVITIIIWIMLNCVRDGQFDHFSEDLFCVRPSRNGSKNVYFFRMFTSLLSSQSKQFDIIHNCIWIKKNKYLMNWIHKLWENKYRWKCFLFKKFPNKQNFVRCPT